MNTALIRSIYPSRTTSLYEVPKESDSEDNVPKDNVNEICESDIDMEKDEISIETACNIVEKSLELFVHLCLYIPPKR